MLRLSKRMAWVLVVLVVIFTATLTEAQRRRSGGSAGGHHFGGSHSSSHSSGSRSTGRSGGFRSGGRSGGGLRFGGGVQSGGGGYEGEDYDPGYRPNGWYDRGDGWNGFLFLFVVFGGVGLWYAFRRKPGASVVSNSAWLKVDITQVRLVLSADARPFLQQKLLALAESADTRSVEGLHRLLGQTARVLAMAESAWLYAGVVNHQPTDANIAQMTYERLAQDARAQFTDEVIRSANGALVTGDATGLRGDRARDGEGVIVVTFVVAAKRVMSYSSKSTSFARFSQS